MYYVYIIQFVKSGKFYTGLTANLKLRLNVHKSCQSKIAKDLGTFELRFVCIFPNKFIAAQFERYLKSYSGRAFRNKRLV